MWLWVDDPELGESAGDSDEGILWKHTEAEHPKKPNSENTEKLSFRQ